MNQPSKLTFPETRHIDHQEWFSLRSIGKRPVFQAYRSLLAPTGPLSVCSNTHFHYSPCHFRENYAFTNKKHHKSQLFSTNSVLL